MQTIQTVNGIKKINSRSSSKNVDAYLTRTPQKIDDQWVVVTDYRRTADNHGGYEHDVTLRDCTPQEMEALEIADLRSQLSCLYFGRDAFKMSVEEVRSNAAECNRTPKL